MTFEEAKAEALTGADYFKVPHYVVKARGTFRIVYQPPPSIKSIWFVARPIKSRES